MRTRVPILTIALAACAAERDPALDRPRLITGPRHAR